MKHYPSSYWRDYSELEQAHFADGSLLMSEARSTPFGEVAHHWYFFPSLIPVGYLATWKPTGGVLELSEVEVRESHRGWGITRELVAAVESVTGESLYSAGKFTSEGFERLTWLPLAPQVQESAVLFKPQSFVKSWELLVPKNAL